MVEGGRVVFSGVKFMTTSYKSEGAKFHLLVVVHLEGRRGAGEVVCSMISEGVFVDSRKSAREYQVSVPICRRRDSCLLCRSLGKAASRGSTPRSCLPGKGSSKPKLAMISMGSTTTSQPLTSTTR
jgi:hypothetical protein